MSSSGGPVKSVSQKRSATQVLSRRHLQSRQHPASIKKVVSNVGNYVTLAAPGD